MHINIRHAGLHCAHDTKLRGKHGFINELLVIGELAIYRERAGDVAGIALVLGSHIQECHIAVAQEAVVRGSSMAVMKHGAMILTSTDGGVTLMAASPTEVTPVLEHTLQLKLAHTRASVCHNPAVCFAANAVNVAHELDFIFALVHAAVNDCFIQHTVVHTKVLDAIKNGRFGVPSGVSVEAVAGVQNNGVYALEILTQFRGEEHLIHIVLRCKALSGAYLAHENGIVRRKFRKEQGGLSGVNLNGGVHVGLLHAKEVCKARLLAENGLKV
mmetsp:Transcript_11976/g.21383  ORF Transcript_11976/g.21383 Transcript_11976/m.21383 type:complete len:272 (+) Transcript_11976:378-1193(+)